MATSATAWVLLDHSGRGGIAAAALTYSVRPSSYSLTISSLSSPLSGVPLQSGGPSCFRSTGSIAQLEFLGDVSIRRRSPSVRRSSRRRRISSSERGMPSLLLTAASAAEGRTPASPATPSIDVSANEVLVDRLGRRRRPLHERYPEYPPSGRSRKDDAGGSRTPASKVPDTLSSLAQAVPPDRFFHPIDRRCPGRSFQSRGSSAPCRARARPAPTGTALPFEWLRACRARVRCSRPR